MTSAEGPSCMRTESGRGVPSSQVAEGSSRFQTMWTWCLGCTGPSAGSSQINSAKASARRWAWVRHVVGGAVAAAVVVPHAVGASSPRGEDLFAGGFVEPCVDLDRAVAMGLVPARSTGSLLRVAFFGLGRRRVLAHELASLACEQIGRHCLGRLHQRLCDLGRHVLRCVRNDRRVFDVEPTLGQRLGQRRHLRQAPGGHHVLLGLTFAAPPDRTPDNRRVSPRITERIQRGLVRHQPLIHPRTKPLQIGDAVVQFRAR